MKRKSRPNCKHYSQFVNTENTQNSTKNEMSKSKEKETPRESNDKCHAQMVNTAESIAQNTKEVMSKPQDEVNSHDSYEILRKYSQLSANYVKFTANDPETAGDLGKSIENLGSSCAAAVEMASTKAWIFTKYRRNRISKDVLEKVSHVLSALQICSRGAQACHNAVITISAVIDDLDTIVVCIKATPLQKKNEDTFFDHRKSILEMTKMLAEDSESLVDKALVSTQLENAAQNASITVVLLAELVKNGAAALDDSKSQVILINEARNVAKALRDLVQATEDASAKGSNNSAHLLQLVRSVIGNLESLVKSVTEMQINDSQEITTLESIIEEISQEIHALTVPTGEYNANATPKKLIENTTAITFATGKMIAASRGGKKDDIMNAAEMSRAAISNMLSISKGCSRNAPTEELQNHVLKSSQDTATQFQKLLHAAANNIHHRNRQIKSLSGQSFWQGVENFLHSNRNTTATGLRDVSKILENITQCVRELLHVAKELMYIESAETEWVHVDTFTNVGDSIEAMGRELKETVPEMNLRATKEVLVATSAFIRTAGDEQWSEDLVAAGKEVAVAMRNLVDATNNANEESGTDALIGVTSRPSCSKQQE